MSTSYWQTSETEPLRHEMGALSNRQHGGTDQQQPVVAQDSETQAKGSGGGAVSLCEAVLGRLDQVSVRHPGRTRRLATPALNTRVHEIDELIVDRGAVPGNRSHR